MPVFHRFHDVTIYWSKTCFLLLLHTPFNCSPSMGFPWNSLGKGSLEPIGYESWYQKTRVPGYPMVKHHDDMVITSW